ncbi:MAG: cell envelope integrity EipB family protein [Proteobacteria bacterium]|nr:cell envelope integrity EipB family protein [Pseudomonadota bacterium]
MTPAKLSLTAILCCLLLLAAPGAKAAELAAHRAFYRLTLDSTENSGVTNASGAMEYEVIDGCTGWATQQRLDMTVLDRDGGDTHTVSDYSTWESKDGEHFRFRITQNTDDDREVRAGWAELPPGKPGFAVYTQPDKKRISLPAGTVFPMAQTRAVLAAARKGDMFLSLPVFDGTASSGAENTFTVITAHDQLVKSAFTPLSSLPSIFVHMGYFNADRRQMLPDTLISMRYWDNGVADSLRMDFGNFRMAGKLAEFKLLPHRC